MNARQPGIGVIIRRIPIRVRDVSAAGCLLESTDLLPEGTVGQIELIIDGARHVETVQVCRSAQTSGGGLPWRAGARFLPLTAPPATSVRNVVARFEIMDELGSDSRFRSQVWHSPEH